MQVEREARAVVSVYTPWAITAAAAAAKYIPRPVTHRGQRPAFITTPMQPPDNKAANTLLFKAWESRSGRYSAHPKFYGRRANSRHVTTMPAFRLTAMPDPRSRAAGDDAMHGKRRDALPLRDHPAAPLQQVTP